MFIQGAKRRITFVFLSLLFIFSNGQHLYHLQSTTSHPPWPIPNKQVYTIHLTYTFSVQHCIEHNFCTVLCNVLLLLSVGEKKTARQLASFQNAAIIICSMCVCVERNGNAEHLLFYMYTVCIFSNLILEKPFRFALENANKTAIYLYSRVCSKRTRTNTLP